MTLFNPTAWLGLMVDLGCLAFLTVYAYDALVASPTAVLTQLCPAVYALHMVTLLLPSRSRPPTSPRSPKRPQSIWQKTWYAHQVLLPAVAVGHALCVLFGAPLVQYFSETLAFALFVALTTVLPALNALHCQPTRLRRVFTAWERKNQNEALTLWPVVGAVLGVWVSAFAYPLDWDRPWQRWPVPGIFGALIGHSIGLGVGLAYVGCNRLQRIATRGHSKDKAQ